jgi:tetratricopeptide (TPR) repeat protein
MIGNYPFSPIYRIMYLRNLKNINSYLFEQELSKQAIFIPDRASLFKLLHFQSKPYEGFELLPYDEVVLKDILEEKPVDASEVTTDEFDYLTTEVFRLIDEKTDSVSTEKASGSDLIEKFIHGGTTVGSLAEVSSVSGKKLSEQSEKIGEELITDTLAKVYLKQGLYDEAIKSYEKLILKFPEKNSYFAGQIENIKKLISKDS